MWRKCTERKLQGCRRSLALGRRLRSSLHENACDLLRDKVFPILREDDTIRDIRYDELLIRYANDLCTKFASRPHCYSLIRSKIRMVAQFLSRIKKIEPTIDNLSDVFHPRHYDKIVQIINMMGKYNKETGQLEAPSTAFDLGTQLKILCETHKFECIKKSDEQRLKEVDNTALLMKQGLSTSVNVYVKEAQINKRRKKQIVLPSRQDISKLMVYLVGAAC
ncbi:hypothetical protein NQ314_017113 [Rhamnusium bicolor]|uniref:Uncharacterized protein n=1 Tax=Rhamnusium bicolor TaxID=1586634 RepID=A0AAV8WUS4_9CUCU|nr:hypothetical protein NQ314_017113 [Rhamnusium bicolor]